MRSRSISGIPRPRAVVYCADVNKLFVGSDEGKLYIYDASTFDLISSIEYGDDVDNLRYVPLKNRFMSDMEAAKPGRSEWWTQPAISDSRRNSSLDASRVVSIGIGGSKHLRERAGSEADCGDQPEHGSNFPMADCVRQQLSYGPR